MPYVHNISHTFAVHVALGGPSKSVNLANTCGKLD